MKKAFTFAEVLLVLGIIGVLVALCMGAGQVSLRNAYNLYYYRTFNALNTAFDNFIYLKKHERTDAEGNVLPQESLSTAFQNWFNHLTDSTYGISTDDVTSFQFKGLNGDPFYDAVVVTIPTIKTRANNSDRTYYYAIYHCGYLRTAHEGKQAGEPSGFAPILILIGSSNNSSTFPLNPIENYTSIVDNAEVLPAYADNGTIGRILTGQPYEPIVPRTYRQALCSTYDATDENSVLKYPTANFNINTYCSSVGLGSERFKSGTVVLIPPKNMR